MAAIWWQEQTGGDGKEARMSCAQTQLNQDVMQNSGVLTCNLEFMVEFALYLMVKLVYVFPCHLFSCLWRGSIVLMPKMAVQVCPAELPSQVWSLTHVLENTPGVFLVLFWVANGSNSILVLLLCGLSFSKSRGFLLVPRCQELLWQIEPCQVELWVDDTLQSLKHILSKIDPQSLSHSTVTSVWMSTDRAAFFFPRFSNL